MPHLLFLQDDVSLFLQPSPQGILLSQGQHGTEFTGVFAQSLTRLLDGTASQSDTARLTRIEKQQPWLTGLAKAHPAPQSFSRLLLGKALGMLFVELTAQCNERCIHCYADSNPERTESLTADEIRTALHQARALGRPFVQLTGGDPLIHPHLVEAVRQVRELDFAGVEIYTNGLLLSDALLEKLKPFAPRIALSLYSHEAATHDLITGTSHSFQRTTAAIRRAKAAGFEVRIGVALMEANGEQIERIHNYIKNELGVDEANIRFDPVKKTGRGAGFENAADIAYAVAHLPDLERPQERSGKLCISYDGTVYPCIFSRRNRLGNIRTETLAAMLDRLEHRSPGAASASRWQSCQQQLSCPDCQLIAYALGDRTSV